MYFIGNGIEPDNDILVERRNGKSYPEGNLLQKMFLTRTPKKVLNRNFNNWHDYFNYLLSLKRKHENGGSLIPSYQFGKNIISGREAYMNLEALNDPNQQKYSNIANAYFKQVPSIPNLANGFWNKIKSLYYGTKAAYKADAEIMNKYIKDLLNRGNIKEAIFGSPYVDYVEDTSRDYVKPENRIKITKHQFGTTKGGLPTAPLAQKRFKNGFIVKKGDPIINNQIKYANAGQVDGVYSNTPYSIIPASIIRSISGNDTIIEETPEQKRFAFRLPPKVRKASSTDKDRSEYDILSRRFETAMKVANR